jgi:hypothetical protein
MMNKVMQKIHSIPKRVWVRKNPFCAKLFFTKSCLRELLKERGRNRHECDRLKLWTLKQFKGTVDAYTKDRLIEFKTCSSLLREKKL